MKPLFLIFLSVLFLAKATWAQDTSCQPVNLITTGQILRDIIQSVDPVYPETKLRKAGVNDIGAFKKAVEDHMLEFYGCRINLDVTPETRFGNARFGLLLAVEALQPVDPPGCDRLDLVEATMLIQRAMPGPAYSTLSKLKSIKKAIEKEESRPFDLAEFEEQAVAEVRSLGCAIDRNDFRVHEKMRFHEARSLLLKVASDPAAE